MVAGHRHDRDTRLSERRHLAREEQASRGILPVAVEDIADEQDRVHRLVARQAHEVVQGAPRRCLAVGLWATLVADQALQRAIKVEIRRVEQFQRYSLRLRKLTISGHTLSPISDSRRNIARSQKPHARSPKHFLRTARSTLSSDCETFSKTVERKLVWVRLPLLAPHFQDHIGLYSCLDKPPVAAARPGFDTNR